MQFRIHTLLPLLATLPISAQDASLDWPQWRGRLGTGEAHADPPTHWSETENIAWRTAIPGRGKSTPIIANGRIFLLTAVPTREASREELAARTEFEDQFTQAPDHHVALLAMALSQATGELLWETQLSESLPLAGNHQTNGYASFSPVVDGERLYVSFGSYGVYGLDVATGEVQWSYDLGPQRTRRGWGEAGSPALAGEILLVVADQEDASRIHALDKRTGKALWVRERDEPSTWTTPLVVETGDVVQVVVNGTNAVRSYAAATGEVLWHCAGQTVNAIPSPVSDGQLAICMSGFRGSACTAISLSGRGDLRASEGSIAWEHTGGTSYVPSPALVDGRIYFLGGNAGRLSCLSLDTGELLLDRHRLDLGNIYASPLAAAGRLYLCDRDGTTIVLRHTDEVEILATNVLDDPIDASPVAVGKTLYLRSETQLYAIEEQ